MGVRVRCCLVVAWGCLSACAASDVVTVTGNGAFSSEGDAVLVASSVRRTRSGAPWFADPSARDWQLVFGLGGEDLAEPLELARFDDVATGQGGGVLSAPLWWLAEHERVVGLAYHEAVIYDLANGSRQVLSLPEAASRERFLLPDIDLRDYAGPVAVAPSPDGATVAVHWQAALLVDGAFGEMVFFHAVGFFGRDGATLSADTLRDFAGTTSQLRRASPTPSPMYPSPEPPAHQPYNVVPSHHVLSFVWTPDSAAVVFIGVPAGEAEERIAVRVARDGGLSERVERVPAASLPAPGGPVSLGGDYLLVHEPEGAPDALSLRRWPTDASQAYGQGGDAVPDEVGFAW